VYNSKQILLPGEIYHIDRTSRVELGMLEKVLIRDFLDNSLQKIDEQQDLALMHMSYPRSLLLPSQEPRHHLCSGP
jgi:hypothetical protein